MSVSRGVACAVLGAGCLTLVPSLVFGAARLPAAGRDCSITCANGSKCSCYGKCSCYCSIFGSATCSNVK